MPCLGCIQEIVCAGKVGCIHSLPTQPSQLGGCQDCFPTLPVDTFRPWPGGLRAPTGSSWPAASPPCPANLFRRCRKMSLVFSGSRFFSKIEQSACSIPSRLPVQIVPGRAIGPPKAATATPIAYDQQQQLVKRWPCREPLKSHRPCREGWRGGKTLSPEPYASMATALAPAGLNPFVAPPA